MLCSSVKVSLGHGLNMMAYVKELTGLTSGKLYSVKVAYTKIGQGTRSRSTSITVGGSTIPRRFYPKEKDTSCLHIQYQVSR